jgi:hypothetical protein
MLLAELKSQTQYFPTKAKFVIKIVRFFIFSFYSYKKTSELQEQPSALFSFLLFFWGGVTLAWRTRKTLKLS